MQAAPASIATTAPIAFWRIAQAFLQSLHMLFGAPADVARRHTLLHDAHALLASWLRVGEAMMRRLIAIEAAAFAKREARQRRRAKRQRTRQLVAFLPDKPEDWRVHFRCTTADRRRPAGKPPPKTAQACKRRNIERRLQASRPPHFHSAWPLALRYEALLRAFNDPLRYARRLAQRLHAAPQLLRAVLAPPPEYVHRVDRADDLTAEAERHWPTPDTT